MPQVVYGRGVVSTAVAPAQLLAQSGEDTLYAMRTQRHALSLPARADEERGLVLRRFARQITLRSIATQCLGAAVMHRHLT